MASHGISRSEYAAQSRDEHLREKELKKIKEYNELAGIVQGQRLAKEYTLDALEGTARLLRLNPEYYTIWNYRREILQQVLLVKYSPPEIAPSPTSTSTETDPEVHETEQDPEEVTKSLHAAYTSKATLHLKEELAFLLPLLSSFPKCYWIWNHRLWTLQRATEILPADKAGIFWQEELGLVGLMLRRDVRNFHGWMYRRFVISNIESPRRKNVSSDEVENSSSKDTSLVEQEFAYTTKMVQGIGGMSNYSAWHNRSKLIPRLLSERNYGSQERMDFLEDELELLKRNISTNPHDQSLWFYHRWLIYSNTITPDRDTPDAISPAMSRGTKLLMLAAEIGNLQDLLEAHAECKYILKALVEYVGLSQRVRKDPKDPDGDEDEEEWTEDDEKKQREDARGWLARLISIDPMRKGRYQEILRGLED
ncbi:protein prenylyltransferase [Choiromyces venosus 120613-1]|uniref:Geranylgeranyl transferase type-2 subunit alpha n=1 Tax=Choiromyces venosus 120613-1 TaxID=1336337 RepID=A0A3N4J7U4_9PEZI|nr:protein prenylyltransferase [Choiromyces venosus 120613-1]